jgi:hypothetical protein
LIRIEVVREEFSVLREEFCEPAQFLIAGLAAAILRRASSLAVETPRIL